MPIGDVESVLYQQPAAVFLAKTFGAKGLHDHLRIRPLVEYARKNLKGRPLRVLEVGCGEGWSLFELAKVQGPSMSAEGYDFDPEDIEKGQRIANAQFPNVHLHCADATALVEIGEKFDVILFMDFLEHVQHPENIIARLEPCLLPGGKVIVSVPTPRYPIIFTREMHERIGHVLDGYTEETLAALFSSNLKPELMTRNTGLPAQFGCRLQARLPQLPYLLDWGKNIVITTIFRKLDFWNGEKSCSLFAVFDKA